MDRASYANRNNLILEYRLAIKAPMTEEQLRNLPNDKQVGLWRDAKLFYRLRYYPTLEEVPEECKDGKAVYVRQGTVTHTWYWNDFTNDWEYGGEAEDSLYRG